MLTLGVIRMKNKKTIQLVGVSIGWVSAIAQVLFGLGVVFQFQTGGAIYFLAGAALIASGVESVLHRVKHVGMTTVFGGVFSNVLTLILGATLVLKPTLIPALPVSIHIMGGVVLAILGVVGLVLDLMGGM